MKPSILGIGSVSALGCGVDSLLAGLEGSALPRMERRVIRTLPDKLDVPVYTAVVDGLERFIPRRALRRIDDFTRMALLASFLAVEDAALKIEDGSRVGVVFGTGFGPLRTTFAYQDTIIDDGDKGASPTLFAGSVHNAPASSVSIFMKVEGPCLTITSFELTTTQVLSVARTWLDRGIVDYVLAGVGDEYCDVLGYALDTHKAEKVERMDPLRFDHCSYVPGEGFACFLLGGEAEQGKYGNIHAITSERSADRLDGDMVRDHRAIFLSANGDSQSGPFYARLGRVDAKVAAYSPLYGAMPTGLGFDVALAGICRRAGRLYPSAAAASDTELDLLTESVPLSTSQRIGCLECSPRHATLISLGGC